MAIPTFAHEFFYDQFRFYVTSELEKTCTLMSCGYLGRDLVIPSVAKDGKAEYTVTVINASAFENLYELSTVAIPETITFIGSKAFSHCESLKSVNLPSSLIGIGNRTFQDCYSLTSITIPSSLTKIGVGAFAWCRKLDKINVNENNTHFCSINGVLFNHDCSTLIQFPAGLKVESYDIPSSVTTIAENAFMGCQLSSVYIPNSVTSIEPGPFAGCSLHNIMVNEDNPKYKSINNVLFDSKCTELIQCPLSLEGDYTIPSTVTKIGKYAFYFCVSVTSVDIPHSVNTIGESAFSFCVSLTSIDLPNTILEIGDETFYLCSDLETVNLPEYITSIGQSAFANCEKLTSITLPATITSIGQEAFANCDLTEVYYNAEEPKPFYSPRIFKNSDYKATLYVPQAAIRECQTLTPWRDFKEIRADYSGIEQVTIPSDSAPCQVFTLGGIKIADSTDGLTPGLYIIRQGSKIKKITVK